MNLVELQNVSKSFWIPDERRGHDSRARIRGVPAAAVRELRVLDRCRWRSGAARRSA